MQKVLFAEFNRYFLWNFSYIFSSCYTQTENGKIPALLELNWYCDGNFTQLALLIKTFVEKSQTT